MNPVKKFVQAFEEASDEEKQKLFAMFEDADRFASMVVSDWFKMKREKINENIGHNSSV